MNFLLIVCDQLRADCVGPGRFQPSRTPHLDALEATGLAFDRAYTATPLCCPARQAFLSGQRPEVFGALWNYDQGIPAQVLEPSPDHWPARFTAAGYRTGYLGKWHVHPTKGPKDFGFEDEVGDADYAAFRERAHPGANPGGGWFGGVDPVPVEDSMTHWLAARAIDLMRGYAGSGAPWLLRLDFHEPHLPCRPCEPFASRWSAADARMWPSFRERFDGKPAMQRRMLRTWGIEGKSWDDWAPAVARYLAVIEQMDDAIGLVLGELRRLGLEDDTVVAFTTDHGDMGGSHRMIDKHCAMYEDIVRVPMVVRWPGRTRPGTRTDAWSINMTDLAATLLAHLDPSHEAPADARPLQPVLDGAVPADWRDAAIATYNGQQFGLYTQRMIRRGEWKYIWNLADEDELYDLRNDPWEMENRIADPALAFLRAELRQHLWDELRAWGDTSTGNPWLRDQLLGPGADAGTFC